VNKDKFQIYLVSDSTGGTLENFMAACLGQFEGVDLDIHMWPLTSSFEQIDLIVDAAKENSGIIFYTLVEHELAAKMEKSCKEKNIQCLYILDDAMNMLSEFFHKEYKSEPGLKQRPSQISFDRMRAVDYALRFDEGKNNIEDLEEADVIIVGPSRTSKTPTCIYLANKCVKAANLPFTREADFPHEVLALKDKLIIGLVAKPERLVDLRRNRLKVFDTFIQSDYIDKTAIEEEIKNARKFYSNNAWPVIDVTNRSVEDVCDDIIFMLKTRGQNIE